MRGVLRRGLRGAAVLALASLDRAEAQTLEFPSGEDAGPEAGRFSLQASLVPATRPDFRAAIAAAAADAWAPEEPLVPVMTPNKKRAIFVTSGVLLGTTAAALWSRRKDGFVPFHVTIEHWFGKNTYAGGADKASHFVLYNNLSRELHIAYSRMNYPDDRAYRMAFATSMAAGLIIELGDAVGPGPGFSYEDLIMDALGAGTAVFITKHGLDDVAGFRFGLVPERVPSPCCPINNPGKDYSVEIYTGDLKLAGFAKRLGVNPGPARFLLLSTTYTSKGYKHSLPDFHQQQIGIEVGVNFPEILKAVGVKDTTWWGRALYMAFNLIRVPYTQIGYRYDFIHHQWLGPNIGEEFDPGP